MRRETPTDRLNRLTLELCYDTAAGHLMSAARRLAEAFRYNPDWASQPRIPAGNPDGGQWVDEGGPAGSGVAAPASRPSALPVAAMTRNFIYACRVLNLDPNEASEALHAPKETMKLRDDCTFDLDTGDIIYNGEVIGNLKD